MREINPDGVTPQNQNVIILQADPRQQQLVKVNRYLVYMVLSLMTLVLLLGFLLWPTTNPLSDFKGSAVQLRQATPVLSAEINVLKSQVAGLVGGSIESKLRLLEDSIRAGSVSNALGTIQDLKRDVRVLQASSEPAILKENPRLANDILLEEVSHLKNLIYLTLASVSLMFAAIAGIWVNKRYRLTHQRSAYLSQENKQ
ncbi:MAG: hypothetical protein HOP02_10780 [Methylococcaceae bacterium]|nr:hypothetical protein [Methylococcaceae bacterium]